MPRYSNTMSLGFPPFTKAIKWLLIINGVILLADSTRRPHHASAVDITVLLRVSIPAMVTHGYVYQVVTYAFLHSGLGHIFFNMLALWMFGSQFEMDWGTHRFLEFYFFCVIGAALTTIVVSYVGLLGLDSQNSRPSVLREGFTAFCSPLE